MINAQDKTQSSSPEQVISGIGSCFYKQERLRVTHTRVPWLWWQISTLKSCAETANLNQEYSKLWVKKIAVVFLSVWAWAVWWMGWKIQGVATQIFPGNVLPEIPVPVSQSVCLFKAVRSRGNMNFSLQLSRIQYSCCSICHVPFCCKNICNKPATFLFLM